MPIVRIPADNYFCEDPFSLDEPIPLLTDVPRKSKTGPYLPESGTVLRFTSFSGRPNPLPYGRFCVKGSYRLYLIKDGKKWEANMNEDDFIRFELIKVLEDIETYVYSHRFENEEREYLFYLNETGYYFTEKGAEFDKPLEFGRVEVLQQRPFFLLNSRQTTFQLLCNTVSDSLVASDCDAVLGKRRRNADIHRALSIKYDGYDTIEIVCENNLQRDEVEDKVWSSITQKFKIVKKYEHLLTATGLDVPNVHLLLEVATCTTFQPLNQTIRVEGFIIKDLSEGNGDKRYFFDLCAFGWNTY